MSDTVTLQVAIGLIFLFGLLLVAMLGYFVYRLDRQQAARLDSLAVVAHATHGLVNGQMGIQLKISSIALRRVADLTGHADDCKAADLAERSFREHEAKQELAADVPDT